jgi:hypothetical protein
MRNLATDIRWPASTSRCCTLAGQERPSTQTGSGRLRRSASSLSLRALSACDSSTASISRSISISSAGSGAAAAATGRAPSVGAGSAGGTPAGSRGGGSSCTAGGGRPPLARGAPAEASSQAVLAALEAEIRKCSQPGPDGPAAAAAAAGAGADEVAAFEQLGRGGFGRVYLGAWHGAPAAIKVQPSGGRLGARARQARETGSGLRRCFGSSRFVRRGVVSA